MGAYVYYDGFNFYYRLFKNKRRKYQIAATNKWMNLLLLSQRLAPGQPIDWIGYFTANVRKNHSDPDQHLRQRAYISALRTISCLEVVEGTFQPATKNGIPQNCSRCGPNATHRVDFATFEEKGSDVNLAARLVRDAALNAFTEAHVVSNDSDLKEAIRIATQDFGRIVHVWSPDVSVSNDLTSVATSAKPLVTKGLKQCRFPLTVVNQAGVAISCPVPWR